MRNDKLYRLVSSLHTPRKFRIIDCHKTETPNVVSFSLYGNNPRYIKGAQINIENYKKWFPEFVCRFYVAKDLDKQIYKALIDQGSEVFVMNGSGISHKYTFWRFLASEDTLKRIFLIRDIDSTCSKRERDFYVEWRLSGKKYNIIRDHPSHNSRIMGGMWGGLTQKFFISMHFIKLWRYITTYGLDQRFLSDIIYPMIISDCHVQDIMLRFPDEKPSIQNIDKDNFSFIGEISTSEKDLVAWRNRFKELCIEGGLL